MEVARYGHGNTLNSPYTYAKLEYDAPPSSISIYDGAYCTSSNYDTNGTPYTPTSCTSYSDPTLQTVYYDFYVFNNDNSTFRGGATTPPATPDARFDSTDFKANAWKTVNLGATLRSRSSASTDGRYFVIMYVHFKEYGTNADNYGGVNAFRIMVGTPSSSGPNSGVATSYGLATYDANDYTNRSDYPIVVQHRPLAGSTGTTDSIDFYFAPGCDITNPTVANLKWFDADYGTSAQPENIGWVLYDDTTGSKVPTVGSNKAQVSGSNPGRDANNNVVTIGGSGSARTFAVKFLPGHKYHWQWNNVDTHNGVQVTPPFDSYNYVRKCGYDNVAVLSATTKAGNIAPGTTLKFTTGMDNIGNTAGPAAAVEVKNPDVNYVTSVVGSQTNGKDKLITSFSYSKNGKMADGEGQTGHYYWNRSSTPVTGKGKGPRYDFSYLVAANTPNGTKLCFHADVTPSTTTSPKSDHDQTSPEICYTVNGGVTVMHKIFTFNGVNLVKQFVRDNENFPFNLTSFIWPDAGKATSDGTKHLWLAGIWDDRGGNGVNPNVNNITIFNTKAEANCPGNAGQCQQDVPLAYVPQDDGSGAANSATNDGSQTPNGNLWYSVLKGTNPTGVLGGYQICTGGIAAQNQGYGACGAGGLALNPITYNIGGATGTHLKKVEISDIHAEASNVQTSMNNSDFGQVYQGKQPAGNLQSDARNTNNLPSGSQNDPANGGSDLAGIWDNVHSPLTSTASRFTAPTAQNANFGSANVSAAYTATPATGNFDPTSLGNIAALVTTPVTSQGTATSLLQDGHGNGYRNSTSEPFTLTGDVESADISLGWDEYVNWNQVDDKGHWYTTRGNPVTGIDSGPQTQTNVTVQQVSGSPGFSQYQYTTYYYQCYNSSTNTYTFGSTTNRSSVPAGCTVYFQQDTYTQPTLVCYNTGWQYTTTGYNYFTQDPTHTQFGWLNSNKFFTGTLRGSNGTQSYFGGGYEASTPPWAKVTDFMQDTAISAMDKTGATTAAAPPGFWQFDRSDPVYTNRAVFDQLQTYILNTGWQYTQSCYWEYPNGNLSSTGVNGGTATYYQNERNEFENTTTVTNHVAGQYNFTYDGVEDGTVDTSWRWASNFERVQYENTFKGHTRKLGNRTTAFDSTTNAFPACPAATDPRLDSDLLGVHLYDASMGTTDDCWALPGRAAGLIYNPTISVATGDVFAGQNLDSYFSSSNASSAFLFSNGQISHFNGASGVFGNYYNNVDQTKSKTDFCTRSGGSGTHTGCSGTDPAHLIFKANGQTLDTMIAQGQANGAPNYGNLGGKIYYVSGCDPSTNAYHLNSTTFNGGSGTVIVNCNLEITGNLSYAGAGANKGQVPSIGFIVLGNIHVDPGVTSIVGSYFANGYFDSGSLVDQVVDDGLGNTSIVPTNDPVTSDTPLNIQGLVIANSFYLVRQPNGTTLRSNTNAENFNYDGRIVVNPPPGFSAIFNASAAWNETVPFN